ncbi:hypothetical protein LJ655_13900 [Paraburkholderia sp. MMS20-SJTN17]|uniref:Uncharacterized protein n=1 Tax=Paraburkholderia translucens TaxID=2886945 RepID=A0ABS8KDX6_9BURK|nr:hypothetical protein [Paraburkholderia sp. MMS20-SJTN17]MCC8402966.1 hypothetical protein [Paraburkholderia sp. MMS20-SJTN17]
MATHDASQTLDPSDYIAHHLQNFSMSSSGVPHAGEFLGSPYALVLAAVLFVVLVGVAALRDRGALFSVGREISFGRRLYVWWSCAWRQWLAGTLLFIVAVVAFHFLAPRTAVPLMKFSEHLITPEVVGSSPAWSEVIAAMPAIVAAVIYLLVSLPVAGYMVRSGLVAHAFPHPERFGVWHALMLGLTTYAWEVPGSLAIADVPISLPDHAADVLRAILVVAWGMYVVLPRQVRRVERLAPERVGAGEARDNT